LRSENESLKERLLFLQKRGELDQDTQLCSQAYFERRLAQELRRAERYCEFLSLVLIDASSALADQSSQRKIQMLRSMGDLIGESIRETDILASLGKNRLALMLTETPKEGAFCLAERLSEKISSTSLPEELGDFRGQTINIGIASFPEDGNDQEDLLQVASSPLNGGSSVLGGEHI
jgi:diguanylate cyclase (GGDEF)-like protein